MGSEDTGGNTVQTPEPPQDEKPQDSEKPSDEQCHPSGDGLLDIQVTAILILRSPEADPEVNFKVGHLMGPAAPLLLMTVHSGDRVHDGDRSRDKDHRSNHGSYYPDDCNRYHQL